MTFLLSSPANRWAAVRFLDASRDSRTTSRPVPIGGFHAGSFHLVRRARARCHHRAGARRIRARPLDRAGALGTPARGDRKSVVEGKSVSVRVSLGGPRYIKKKKKIPKP